jgi:hypothetical protein
MNVQELRDILETYPPNYEVLFMVRLINKNTAKMVAVDKVDEGSIESTKFVIMGASDDDYKFDLN